MNENTNLRGILLGGLSAALGYALFGKIGLIIVLMYFVAKKL